MKYFVQHLKCSYAEFPSFPVYTNVCFKQDCTNTQNLANYVFTFRLNFKMHYIISTATIILETIVCLDMYAYVYAHCRYAYPQQI